ncbi:phage tail spike protein [Peribacillus frigoritolerans]|uniref:phage tail spike protein n=1 Tax=Peribacillus frigoritolerans TaxID=450367 RepID=UPI0021622E10|nr:phage tail spike protein [Peribacillus frigoritolerans]
MLAIKNLEGEVFLLTGASNIVRKRRVNGEKELSLKLDKTVQNAHFFDDIDKLWRVIDFSGEEYPILIYRDVAMGNGYTREINCLHSFFDDMRNHVIYEKFTGSKTFAAMMEFIFAGSGYTYNIIDQFLANDFENFGDDYGLELFKTALERYVAEFTVSGKTVTLRAQIGNTTDFQYRHKFNLESIERDVDALDFSTYGEGFGKGTLHVTYTSPLAAIYGKRSIKAIRDERFTKADSLTATVKEAVDTSLKIALTVKLSDLRASGYNKNHPNEGDTIILVDDRLGLKVDTRIVEIVEALDKKGNVLDCDVTLSNYSNIFEQQRRIHNATKTIADAIEGKRPLPFEALAIAVQQATIALQNAQTELEFPDNGGILAISKTNPNHFVLFNSAGVGISTDAGQTFKTAITASGIVADVVTAGTLRGIIIEGVEIIGSIIRSADEGTEFYVEGGNMILSRTNGRKVTVNPDGIYGLDGAGAITFKADRGLVTSAALGTSNSNVYLAPDSNNEVRVVDVKSIPSDGVAENYSYRPIRAQGLRFGPGANGYIGTEGELRITSSGFVLEDGSVIYRNVRGSVFHGAGFSTTSTNAYIGADSEVRLVNRGYVDGSAGNPIYRDLRAATIWSGHIAPHSGNMYVGSDDEIRMTSRGGYNDGNIIFRNVRANGYFGQFLTADPDLYAYIGTDLGLRVTSRGLASAGPVYRDVTAASFSNGSRMESKSDIVLWEEDALSIICESELASYFLNGDIEQGREIRKYGLVIGGEWKTPEQIINGDGIDQYAMTTFSWRGLQQVNGTLKTHDTKIRSLTETVAMQAAEIQKLSETVAEQQQQLTDFATLTESLTSRLAELEGRVAILEA